jgi:hypothetical protein
MTGGGRTRDVTAPGRRGRGLRAALLGLLLLLPGPVSVPVALTGTLLATEAAAQRRSSGGYSRPRSGGYGRTPSVGGARVTPRTPSTSGGYRRPDVGAVPQARRPALPPTYDSRSAGDRALSRESAGGALGRYREQQDALRRQREAASRPPVPAPLPTPAPGGGGGLGGPRGGTFGSPGGYGGGYGGGAGYSRPARPDWYRERGWLPQPGIFGAGRSFGIWDGVFLWFLLDNLSRAGSVDFFRNHRDDPAIRDWRAEAERQAGEDAELRARLDRLDAELARQPDAPRDPDYLPPGVPPEIALGPRDDRRTPTTGAPAEEGGGIGGWVLPVLLLGGGGLIVLARRRRTGGGIAGGGGMTGHGTTDRMRSAGAMVRNTVSGPRAAASPFRVGMTLQADPTPFILAAGATKLRAPEGIEGNPLVSVQEVGQLRGAGTELTRLYLPDGRSLFQIHLDASGQPDECRVFSLIDEVTPADEAEWAVWLDRAEGLIGWPEFETKDGKVYARAWAPGETRIEPRDLSESIEGLSGSRTVRRLAMLYAAPTGAAAPAPPTEYILVAAVEAEGRASVEIHAGIDVNPAALSLA